jgi:methyl-accepting chemotaxis protein
LEPFLAFLLGIALTAVAGGWLWQTQVRKPLQEVQQGLAAITRHGDLTVTLQPRGLPVVARVGHQLNELAAGFGETIDDFRSQTGQLLSSSEELSATADQIGQNAGHSSQRVEEVTGSAQEVNSVVQDVANNIQSVSEAANESTRSTQQGKQAVDQAAQRLEELKRSSERVDEIIATIQGIAKKTDLLALNAAIEAANAGEAGQGFAVVADEVRKLAEQTANATTQVNDIITEVRSHSDSSYQAMHQVQSQMDEVLGSIEHTDATANQIAAAAEELAATMGETTDNMGEIHSAVDHTADSVNQIEDAALQLGDLASDLQHSLGLFRVSSQEAAGNPIFRKAKLDHLAWRTKLRNHLNGKESLNDSELTSHETCRLGQWIYSEGMPTYGHDATMKDLEASHKKLHQSINSVIELRNATRTDKANEEFKRFQELSEQVVKDLDAMAARAG